jgi:succinoglycan biosynthesis transport protein ExoP
MADLIKAERAYALPDVPEPVEPGNAPLEQSEVVKLYLHILRKRKWLILAVTLTLITGAAVQTYTTTPVYTSTAQIQIDLETPNVLPYQEVSASPQFYFEETYRETQHRILRSKILARRVATRLDLGNSPSFGAATSPGLLREAVPAVTGTVVGLFRKEAPAQKPKPGEKKATRNVDGLAQALLGGLSVDPDKGTRLVSVSYTSHDPKLAQQVVNAFADEYIELNFETRYQAATMATDFLKRELDQLKVKVEKSDEALLSYAREHGIVDVAEGGDRDNIVLQTLARLNAEMATVQTDLISKSVQYESARNASVQNFPENLKTVRILELETKLADSRQKFANLSARYKPEGPVPDIEQLKQEIFEIEDQLVKEKQKALAKVRSEYELAQNHYKSISAALERQKQEANKLNEDSIQYHILKREVESNKQLYEGLLQRLKEAGVSAGLKSSNVHIVERGDLPKAPSGPMHSRNLMLGLLVGLMLGVGLAVMIEYFDNTVKTPDELEKFVLLPSLGVIPTIDRLGAVATKSLPAASQQAGTSVVPYVAPRSAVWEAYRSLRTSILLSHSGTPPRTLLVTSALPGEGKTTTAVNTAIVLAQTGARTLLVDLDMRKPAVGRRFGLNGNQGMSIFLSGNSDLSSQIVETEYDNLFVIPAGPQPPNPAELVGSDRWKKALGLLGEYFQYVVIDSPPVLSVADPLIISTNVDGVVLVVLAGRTPRDAVRKARAHLSHVGATVLGAMINNVDLQDSRYSYYYRYYYRYGYYGNEEGKIA